MILLALAADASFMGGKGTMFGTIIDAVLLGVAREEMSAKALRMVVRAAA